MSGNRRSGKFLDFNEIFNNYSLCHWIYLSAVVSTLTVLSLDWTGQETGDKIVGLLFWSGSDAGEIVHVMSDRFRIIKVKYFASSVVKYIVSVTT